MKLLLLLKVTKLCRERRDGAEARDEVIQATKMCKQKAQLTYKLWRAKLE